MVRHLLPMFSTRPGEPACGSWPSMLTTTLRWNTRSDIAATRGDIEDALPPRGDSEVGDQHRIAFPTRGRPIDTTLVASGRSLQPMPRARLTVDLSPPRAAVKALSTATSRTAWKMLEEAKCSKRHWVTSDHAVGWSSPPAIKPESAGNEPATR